MNVKNCIPEERKREVVYGVPCKEYHLSYIGETKCTLRVRIGEHKQAVKQGDLRNGIAVHTHQSQHAINWDGAKVKRSVSGYWKRRTREAIHIRLSEGNMNLDNGLQLPFMWNLIWTHHNPPPLFLFLFYFYLLYFYLFYVFVFQLINLSYLVLFIFIFILFYFVFISFLLASSPRSSSPVKHTRPLVAVLKSVTPVVSSVL